MAEGAVVTDQPDVEIYRWSEDPFNGDNKVVLASRERNMLPNGKWFRKFKFWIKIGRWFELNIENGYVSVPNDPGHPLRYQRGSGKEWSKEGTEPMVRGFLLDLGIQPRPVTNALTVSLGDILKMPRFISNEQWTSRYSEAESFTVPTLDREPPYDPAFLNFIHNFQLEAPRPGFAPDWKVKWTKTGETHRFRSRDECVDAATTAHLILPESRREEWMRANVDRGSFVFPSQEEFELLRILDEVPFLLPQDQLTEWLRASGAWPPEKE